MTRRLWVAFSTSFLIAVTAAGQGLSDQSSVTTSGTAEVRVVPDQVEVAVGVESVNADLAAAKSSNDTAITRVIEAATRHNIERQSIQTDFISIEPNYESRPVGTPKSYSVRRSVVITSKDIAGFERLLSALVEAGANHVHSVRFMTSKLRAHRDEARKMAAQASLEKARLLAETLGRKVGKVRSISESSDYWSSSYGSWWGRWGSMSQNVSQNVGSSAGESPDGPLAPGRISVTASVSVTFELE